MPVKSTSEMHNNREKELNYTNKELEHKNEHFVLKTIKETRQEIEKKYIETTGQKMQKKATPIREGVLLISKDTSMQDLKKLANKLEQNFGIKTIQIHLHKDEGHRDKLSGVWKENLHAHMVFNWTDSNTGKSLKLNKDDMSKMQDITAETLDLERGLKSTKQHITSRDFKAIKQVEELQDLKRFGDLKPVLEQKERELNMLIDVRAGLEETKEDLKNSKTELEKTLFENSLQRENLKFLETKVEKLREEIKQIEQKHNRGLGF